MTRVVESLNASLHELMSRRADVLVLGEDLLDPYGGAFKVTAGLSTAFPDRVLTTPISEAGIVGMGIGLSMQGFRPIVEIMFGDFVTLIADQLVNQASKRPWLSGEHRPLPLVVRTPMGGRRGYGPTHSQSLETLYFGVPGLTVSALSHLGEPGDTLRASIEDFDGPVLLVENKLLYTRRAVTPSDLAALGFRVTVGAGSLPTWTLTHEGPPDVTLVTYGGMTPLVMDAAAELRRDDDLSCEILVAHRLSPLDVDPIVASVMKTRRVVVVEEGVGDWGWGAEVLARLSGIRLEAPAQRVASKSSPIPASRSLEDKVLPQIAEIVAAALRTVDETFA